MKKTIVCILTFVLAVLPLQITAYAADGLPPRTLPEYVNPRDILITQPPDGTVTASTQISILGSCDPEFPLYMNGAEIQKTERGFFARYVNLAEGENKFTFKNNGKEKTVTVIKSDSVVIPYAEAKYGVINRNYVTRRTNPDENVNLLTPLPIGTSFKLLGETDEYYKIEDGTFVYKVAIDLLANPLPANIISTAGIADEGNFTFVKFKMNVNALFDLSLSENKARLVIHGAQDKSVLPVPQNSRLSNISKKENKDTADKSEYELTFSEKPIGHFVEFKDGEMIVGFRYASKSTGGSLSGKSIIIDPGHGGKDPGALGPLYTKGPAEKDYNLYVALAAAEYLKSRGAEVLLTRSDDTFVELADRVSFILDKKPDISVSVHANSRPVTQDYGGASGSLMFYTFDTGLEAAEVILKSVTGKLETKYTQPIKENFALSRITNCPAILFEMSFMSNPNDYEWLFSKENLELMGKSLGEGIEGYLTAK